METKSFMNRKKTIVLAVTGALLMFYSSVFASYIDHLQTQSAEWAGNPTRTAATDSLDAIFYNPAGTAFMQNGLYTGIGLQVIAFPNEVVVEDSTYPGQQDYKSSTPPSYVPNAYVSYKQDAFAIYSGLNIIGGGGSLYWPNGLPNINLAVQAVGAADGNISIQQTSVIYGATVGGAYALSDNLSISLGARAVYGDEGMKIKTNTSGLGAGNTETTVWDGSWTGTGYCAIIGANYKPVSNLNLAATFESLTRLERKIKVDEDSTGGTLSTVMGYNDGKKFRFDLPAKLSLGAEYAVIPTLKLSLSGIVYFTQYGTYEKPSKTGTESYDLNTPYEIGAGFDWEFIKNVSWSAGVNYSCMNLKDEQMGEGGMIKNDLVDLGTGFKVRTEQGFDVAVGFMRNIYTEKENNATKSSTATYKTKYKESATNVAISVQYKFL